MKLIDDVNTKTLGSLNHRPGNLEFCSGVAALGMTHFIYNLMNLISFGAAVETRTSKIADRQTRGSFTVGHRESVVHVSFVA